MESISGKPINSKSVQKSLIIGITGGSGSGKTGIAKDLVKYFNSTASLLALDNYYYPIEKQPRDKNGRPNFDLPESLNLTGFYEDLILLSSGNNITQPEYTFNNIERIPKTITVRHNPVIIVEGLFIFHLPELLPLYDLKIFIDVEENLKLERRLIRDVKTRGYSKDDVEYCHVNHVLPSYISFIEKQKSIADLILSNNSDYQTSFETLIDFLKSKLDPTFFVK